MHRLATQNTIRYRILLAEEIHCFLILKAKCFDFVSGNHTLHQFMTPHVCVHAVAKSAEFLPIFPEPIKPVAQ